MIEINERSSFSFPSQFSNEITHTKTCSPCFVELQKDSWNFRRTWKSYSVETSPPPPRQPLFPQHFSFFQTLGSVAEWLGRRTWNPEVAGSSPALTTKLELFHGSPEFKSSATLVNSQLVCLRPVEILNHVMFNLRYLFQLFARPN